MFKIAYCAGHYLNTPGKRIPKELDKTETREWVLNNRVADYFGLAATWYEDVITYRVDDCTGKHFLDIPDRTAEANEWGADLYIDIHHNAAGKIFNGGGVEAFSCPGSKKGKEYRDAIYRAVIAAGGLKGNRSTPCQEKRFDSLTMTKMPAVLIEYGYMDSTVDASVILTDAYAQKVAFATMDAIAKLRGLKKKNFPDCPESSVKAEQNKEQYSLEQFREDLSKALGVAPGSSNAEILAKTVTLSINKNSDHPAVKPVQRRLAALGYTVVGTATGVADVRFLAAVCALQDDSRCWVDGEITERRKTWQVLLEME